ncbi:hypothetical protein ACT4S5_12935 [Kocuria oceani]|uniref:hypothetical protein n=1 Tax=Kocuria oceani TaxID=988827 RepID=UPI0040366C6A
MLSMVIAVLLAVAGASIITLTDLPWRGVVGWSILLLGRVVLAVSAARRRSRP